MRTIRARFAIDCFRGSGNEAPAVILKMTAPSLSTDLSKQEVKLAGCEGGANHTSYR